MCQIEKMKIEPTKCPEPRHIAWSVKKKSRMERDHKIVYTIFYC